MVWDGTPWFVGGNAQHSEEVARMLAFVASGGAEGIAQPGDLKVVANSTPNGQVVVSAGGAIIRNRGANSYEQSYVARNPDGDPQSIASQGSTGTRRDLVVVRIEDLNAVGGSAWQGNGADPDDGPFVFSRVIPNVPAGTKRLQDVAGHATDVGFALALITIPANTGTITNAMITDLRQLARPRETTLEFADFGTSTATLTATGGVLFPPFAPSVDVPEWATHARITCTIAQLQAKGNSTGAGNASGRDSGGNSVVDGDTVSFNFDAVVTSTRGVYIASTYGDVRSLRGQVMKLMSYMRLSNDSQKPLVYDDGSQMLWRVTFYERAV